MTPDSATNRPGTGIYLKLKELSEHDKGVHYQSLRLNSRRAPDPSTAEAHMGSRLPLAASISVESARHSCPRYRETYLDLLPRRQPGWSRGRIGLLLYLRPLSQSFYSQRASWSRCSFSLTHLLFASALPLDRHPARRVGYGSRNVQSNDRGHHQRQTHLRPGRRDLVRLGRFVGHSRQPQRRLQGQGDAILYCRAALCHWRYRRSYGVGHAHADLFAWRRLLRPIVLPAHLPSFSCCHRSVRGQSSGLGLCYDPSVAVLRCHLLLRSRRQRESLALANARLCRRYRGLAPGVRRPSHLRSFLQ